MSEQRMEKIKFRRFTLADKEHYERYLFAECERGCEYSFANLYLWGRQSFAERDGQLLFFSQLFVRPPQIAILVFCISFPWGWS